MTTDAENIATIRSQALARLAEITASPKPSYSVGGRSFSWSEYHAQLMQTVDWCDRQKGQDEPYERITEGVSL